VDPARLGICVGSTQGAIARWQRDQQHRHAGDVPAAPRTSDPALAVARRTAARGPLASPSLACASGTAALGIAASWIRRGYCDAAIAGGAEALAHLVYAGFSALRAIDPDTPRPFDARRAGMGLGEGAALLLLQRGAHPGAAHLAGWGLSADAAHLTAPDPSGAGLARAIAAAFADGGVDPTDVDVISAHGTGTVFNDAMEARAFALAFGDRAKTIPVGAIKGAVGHTLAAAGALEAVCCAQILAQHAVPPTVGLEHKDPTIDLDVVHGEARGVACRYALSTSAGFGGINAALLFCCQPTERA
jgi:3-oxoacyl-(acyl-carrier-protein) synthase